MTESSQEARTAAGKLPQERTRLVTIQMDLLNELHSSQVRVDTYMRGYITLREQASICRDVASVLAEAIGNPDRLGDRFYFKTLSGETQRLRVLIRALDPILAIAADEAHMAERVDEHDSHLARAWDAVGTVMNPSQQADTNEVINTVSGSIHTMTRLVEEISTDCERQAEAHLQHLREVIRSIFAIEESRRQAGLGHTTPVRRKRLTDRAPYEGAERGPSLKSDPRESFGDRQAEIGSRSASTQEGWTWRSSQMSSDGIRSPQADRNPLRRS
jgi:hypothetical protein